LPFWFRRETPRRPTYCLQREEGKTPDDRKAISIYAFRRGEINHRMKNRAGRNNGIDGIEKSRAMKNKQEQEKGERIQLRKN